jgi:hypothetical protein
MSNIPRDLPPFFKKRAQTFPNTKEGINALLEAQKISKSEKLIELKRTQADLESERLARIQADQARIQADQARIQADQARIQADQARIQADQARIQERNARIQAEQQNAAMIQAMREDGVPETVIERAMKKAKKTHGDPGNI